MNPLTQSKNTTILPVLIALTLASFALSPAARAVCQEGCDLINANTFLGEDALINTIGGGNTATGFRALNFNTTGQANTANGVYALYRNTTGLGNTANGAQALGTNNTGSNNTANGFFALANNRTGDANTATGSTALALNTTGNNNAANGVNALYLNTNGNGNTASGVSALSSNTTGDKNTASGIDALLSNTTGSFNIALGAEAGGNLTTGSNNIDIGHRGVAGEANTIRIGRNLHTRAFISGISGVAVTGSTVVVDADGQLGVAPSSARFKDNIKPMDNTSEAILVLKPVTFHYKKELDSQGIPQFGLVAEQVEKVNPDLVVRDDQGKPYTVRYDSVNAMLLNEFLKEHRKGEQQDCKIEELEATIAKQQKQIETLAAGLQKVSAQIELSKPAPQTVLNNQ